MIALSLPYPPSMNTLYPSNRKTGRRFLSKRGTAYLAAFRVAVAAAGKPVQPLSGRLGYRLHLYPPDARKRDLSNCLKAVEDCLTKCGVWVDDSQVDVIRVFREGKVKDGSATIYIWDLETECEPF